MTIRGAAATATLGIVLAASVVRLAAHSGPPFPIVSNRIAGAYEVSIWTDPDATDDRRAAGQFWIVLKPTGRQAEVPAGTRVIVAIRARDRSHAPELTVPAAPVDGLIGRQFAALLMDHEGPFALRVAIDGPLGPAEVTGEVDATYDLRPPPVLFFVFVLPFVAIGLLWMRVLWKRRGLRRPEPGREH